MLKGEDEIEHFFTTSTHNWLLFFTNFGRVYRLKGYELQEAGRDARGQHIANVVAFQPEETIAQVLTLDTYEDAPYLVLATKSGMVKKTRLEDYDSPRQAGLIAINLNEDDEVVAAKLIDNTEDLILISRKGQSLRFTASDEALRPMGRATAGVRGMKFREDDQLLTMGVIEDDSYVFTITDGGFAKRTSVEEYRTQNRGGFGIKVANLPEARGELVGGEVVTEDSEVLVIMESGNVVRSAVEQVPIRGRDTMGVIFASPGKKDRIVGATLNYEIDGLEDDADEGNEVEEHESTDESPVQDQVSSDTDRNDEGE